MEKGIGIMELANMPAALRTDLMYLLREMGKLRRQRRTKEKPAAGIARGRKARE